MASPIDPASLAVFRIAFGSILFCDILRHFHYGWIRTEFVEPIFHFSYLGLGRVRPWPGSGMYILFGLMGLFALLTAVGLFFRVAAPLLFLTYTYVFLLDRAYYQNHYYLIVLLSLILCFTGAQRAWSGDAWLDKRDRAMFRSACMAGRALTSTGRVGLLFWSSSEVRSGLAPWGSASDLVCEQELNAFSRQASRRFWSPLFFSYAGLGVDLSLPFLLYFRKTRWVGVAIGVCFHTLNGILWDIDVFPFLMIVAMSLLPAGLAPQYCFPDTCRTRRVLVSRLEVSSKSLGAYLFRFVHSRSGSRTALPLADSAIPHGPGREIFSLGG